MASDAEPARAAHARFLKLLEMMPLPLAHVVEGGRVEFVNDRFTQLFGYTREDVPTIAEWFRRAYPDEEYRRDVLARWEQALRKGTVIHSTEPYRIATRQGGARLVEVSAIGVGEELLAAFVDVTERTEAEAALGLLNAELEERVLQRTAELSAANHELDSFAYAVSHDLRAPLRAMSGFSQALIEDYGDALPGEARLYLDQIRKASQNMSQLVDGLLVLSRSTRGEVHHVPVDLSAMATRVCHELATTMPGAAPPAWQIESGLSAQGDGRMLEVVLTNLLANGWKYSSRHPNPEVRFYAEARDGHTWFCVADNGVGFDMRHAERLFKPFQRLHRQDEFPGIGIGLATVQRVIQRHGGTIEAEAAVGRGATFRFCLPGRPSPNPEVV